MPNKEDNKESLYFVEFMQMCADSGFISEDTAREICIFAKYQGGVEAIPPFPGDYPENENRFTDLLASIPPGERTFNNYIVTEDNSYAVELARTVALIPRIWKSISPILFHAGTGQGKTHLLSAIAASSRQNTLFLNLNDLKMGYNYCIKTNKESQLLKWIIGHNFLLLDDLQFVQNDLQFQHFLCSVFNQMPQGKSAIVLCSNSEVENMQNLDSTFFSRISSGISIELKTIDLPGRINILNQLFSDTGFGPDDEIISYIAINISQNIRTLKAAGRAVLAYLLASPSSQSITVEKVEEILESMNLRRYAKPKSKDMPNNNSNITEVKEDIAKQISLSEKPSKPEDPESSDQTNIISPYIVVDIDTEEAELEVHLKQEPEPEPEPEIEPEDLKNDLDKIIEVPEEVTPVIHETEVNDEDKITEVPEEVAPVIHETEVNDEDIFKQALEANRKTKTVDKIIPEIATETISQPETQVASEFVKIDSDSKNQEIEEKAETFAKEESKKTIENATSINVQIAALKKAAEKRISQLENKNPDNPEISKLRLAIIFLDQGKIESAMLALK